MNILVRLWRSLAFRMLGVFLITGIAACLVISIAWGIAMKHQFDTKIRPHLQQYMVYIAHDIGMPPSPEQADRLARRLAMNIYISGPDVNYSTTGQPLDASNIEFEDHERPFRRKNKPRKKLNFDIGDMDDRTVLRNVRGEYTVYYELRHRDRHRRRGHSGPPPGAIVFLTTLLLLGLILAACFWIIHRLLRPVRNIQQGVALMGSGNLEHRINVKRRDDLGDLAGSINTMAGDIEQMLNAKRELLLGISHELRSPITRARISAELLDESDTRDRIKDDLHEMETLVTELLESERLNTRHGVLNPSLCDPGDVIASVINDTFDAQVTVSIERGTEMRLDETRLRLLLRNLVGNAVRHGSDASVPPHVDAHVIKTSGENILVMSVRDHGPGIGAEHITHLTDPFYRVDPSRTRATGGFGLGLYLCRLIAEAHDGEIQITSTPGEGTTVRATLRDQLA